MGGEQEVLRAERAKDHDARAAELLTRLWDPYPNRARMKGEGTRNKYGMKEVDKYDKPHRD